MARARNIKPGYYQNDELAQCSLLARFIFPGLWMLADREGRLEDRALRIKAQLLPYDTANIEKLLAELDTRGFIVRYSVGGSKYIQISNFKKHQNPHCKEPVSTIPGPDGLACDECKTQGEHRANPGESGAGTGQTPDENRSRRADSGFPLTDSGYPESGASTEPLPPVLDTPRFREAWARWVSHRTEVKRPLTPTNAKSQLKKLAREGETAAVARIEKSIENGWRGLWYPDDQPPERNGKHPSAAPVPSAADTRRDLDDLAAKRERIRRESEAQS